MERSVEQIVTATIDGQLVSWTNEYAGPGVATVLPAPVGVDIGESNGSGPNAVQAIETPSTVQQLSIATATHSSTSPTPDVPESRLSVDRGWSRQAYYSAAGRTAQGLTFLNHFGGTTGIPGTAAGGPP